jgi:NhaP-type Na+/H+ or K+/H+ antiporter
LNVESGLNDGICVPVLFVFLASAAQLEVGFEQFFLATLLVAKQIGIGAAVGAGVTYLAILVGKRCNSRGWITESWKHVTVFALAVACFGIAHRLEGSGFIASFVGGILFGILLPGKRNLLAATEGAGDTMALATWVAFGAGVIARVIGSFTWTILAYSVLSLTVIRMVPVFLSLWGTGLKTRQKLFIGWFGPRGLANIVFGLIVLNKALPNGRILTLTVACTVTLSVLAHGCTANPLAAALDRRRNQ